MPDARALAAILVAIFVGAFMLRLVAARNPSLRRWANLLSILVLVLLIAVIAFVVSSVVSTLGGALRR